MPTYDFLCTNAECKHEFEDFQWMNDPPPVCPKCGAETKRQISFEGGVKVELYGEELYSKLRAEGESLKRKARKDEKLLSNLVGETKYQDNVKAFGG